MNEKNYASLEACQRLAAKGIMLETDCVWVSKITFNTPHEKILLRSAFERESNYYDNKSIPAPSMPEVWRELKQYLALEGISYIRLVVESNTDTTVEIPFASKSFRNANPTDALIDLLIWTVERRKEQIKP
jgi:hypothetical protein